MDPILLSLLPLRPPHRGAGPLLLLQWWCLQAAEVWLAMWWRQLAAEVWLAMVMLVMLQQHGQGAACGCCRVGANAAAVACWHRDTAILLLLLLHVGCNCCQAAGSGLCCDRGIDEPALWQETSAAEGQEQQNLSARLDGDLV